MFCFRVPGSLFPSVGVCTHTHAQFFLFLFLPCRQKEPQHPYPAVTNQRNCAPSAPCQIDGRSKQRLALIQITYILSFHSRQSLTFVMQKRVNMRVGIFRSVPVSFLLLTRYYRSVKTAGCSVAMCDVPRVRKGGSPGYLVECLGVCSCPPPPRHFHITSTHTHIHAIMPCAVMDSSACIRAFVHSNNETASIRVMC